MRNTVKAVAIYMLVMLLLVTFSLPYNAFADSATNDLETISDVKYPDTVDYLSDNSDERVIGDVGNPDNIFDKIQNIIGNKKLLEETDMYILAKYTYLNSDEVGKSPVISELRKTDSLSKNILMSENEDIRLFKAGDTGWNIGFLDRSVINGTVKSNSEQTVFAYNNDYADTIENGDGIFCDYEKGIVYVSDDLVSRSADHYSNGPEIAQVQMFSAITVDELDDENDVELTIESSGLLTPVAKTTIQVPSYDIDFTIPVASASQSSDISLSDISISVNDGEYENANDVGASYDKSDGSLTVPYDANIKLTKINVKVSSNGFIPRADASITSAIKNKIPKSLLVYTKIDESKISNGDQFQYTGWTTNADNPSVYNSRDEKVIGKLSNYTWGRSGHTSLATKAYKAINKRKGYPSTYWEKTGKNGGKHYNFGVTGGITMPGGSKDSRGKKLKALHGDKQDFTPELDKSIVSRYGAHAYATCVDANYAYKHYSTALKKKKVGTLRATIIKVDKKKHTLLIGVISPETIGQALFYVYRASYEVSKIPKLVIRKYDSNRPNANMKGAVFGIYSDKACKKRITKKTIGSNNQATYKPKKLTEKTYFYVKELKTPDNSKYELNTNVYRYCLKPNGSDDKKAQKLNSKGKWVTAEKKGKIKNTPTIKEYDYPGFNVIKFDPDNPDANLNGTSFDVYVELGKGTVAGNKIGSLTVDGKIDDDTGDSDNTNTGTEIDDGAEQDSEFGDDENVNDDDDDDDDGDGNYNDTDNDNYGEEENDVSDDPSYGTVDPDEEGDVTDGDELGDDELSEFEDDDDTDETDDSEETEEGDYSTATFVPDKKYYDDGTATAEHPANFIHDIRDNKNAEPKYFYVLETKSADGYEVSQKIYRYALYVNGEDDNTAEEGTYDSATDTWTWTEVEGGKIPNTSTPVGVGIKKEDIQTGNTPQGDGVLNDGGIFMLYANEDMKINGKEYKADDEIGQLKWDDSAQAYISDAILPSGVEVYVKEIKPPTGYKMLDNNMIVIEMPDITKEADKYTEINGAKYYIPDDDNLKFKNAPFRHGLQIVKEDIGFSSSHPEGEGDLEGVKLNLINESANPVMIDDDGDGTGDREVTPGNVITTMTVSWNPDYIDVDEKNSETKGAYTAQTPNSFYLPYGTYGVVEVASPDSNGHADNANETYRMSDGQEHTFKLCPEDDSDDARTNNTYDGYVVTPNADKQTTQAVLSDAKGWLEPSGGTSTGIWKNQIEMGGASIIKSDAQYHDTADKMSKYNHSEVQGDTDLSGIQFKIYNISTDTGDKKKDGKIVVYDDGKGGLLPIARGSLPSSTGRVVDTSNMKYSASDLTSANEVCTITTYWDKDYDWTDENGNKHHGAYHATTGADTLPIGTYAIVEVKSNDSYNLTDGTVRIFNIADDDDDDVQVTCDPNTKAKTTAGLNAVNEVKRGGAALVKQDWELTQARLDKLSSKLSEKKDDASWTEKSETNDSGDDTGFDGTGSSNALGGNGGSSKANDDGNGASGSKTSDDIAKIATLGGIQFKLYNESSYPVWVDVNHDGVYSDSQVTVTNYHRNETATVDDELFYPGEEIPMGDVVDGDGNITASLSTFWNSEFNAYTVATPRKYLPIGTYKIVEMYGGAGHLSNDARGNNSYKAAPGTYSGHEVDEATWWFDITTEVCDDDSDAVGHGLQTRGSQTKNGDVWTSRTVYYGDVKKPVELTEHAATDDRTDVHSKTKNNAALHVGENTMSFKRMCVDNQVKRGDFKVQKQDENSNILPYIPFVIENVYSGEKHVFITDEQGMYRSNTNKGVYPSDKRGRSELIGTPQAIYYNPYDSLLEKAESGETITEKELMDLYNKYNSRSRMYFWGAEEGTDSYGNSTDSQLATKAYEAYVLDDDNDLEEITVNGPIDLDSAALPYGSYRITELRSDTNANFDLVNGDINVESDTQGDNDDELTTLVLTDPSNYKPSIESDAYDKSDNDKKITEDQATNGVTIEDKITYDGFEPNKKYTAFGYLIDTSDVSDIDNVDINSLKRLCDKNGNEIMAKTVLSPNVSHGDFTQVFDNITIDDVENINKFTLFEYVYEGETDTPTGQIIATHINPLDSDQTISIVGIHTTAKTDDGKMIINGKDTTLIDTVAYKGLDANTKYTMQGRVYDKQTGETLKDADGKEVIAEQEFTSSDTGSGEMEMTFKFKMPDDHDGDLVVFEKCLDADGNVVADHENPDDEDQTLHQPKIGTTAIDKEDGDHYIRSEQNVTVIDTVSYENLLPEKEYTMTGVLMDKETGQPLGLDGTKASKTFTTPKAEGDAKLVSGTVDIEFTFDATTLHGKKLVAFETCTYDGYDIAIHNDINDESQTVTVSDIHTTARDGKDGDKFIDIHGDQEIVDTVYYEGLEGNKKYRMSGVLMNRDDGSQIMFNGAPITAEQEFTASDTGSGEMEMTFNVPEGALNGAPKLVVYEYCYDIDNPDHLIASHADINDENQFIDVHDEGVADDLITQMSQTGDLLPYTLVALIIVAGCVCGSVLYVRNRRK